MKFERNLFSRYFPPYKIHLFSYLTYIKEERRKELKKSPCKSNGIKNLDIFPTNIVRIKTTHSTYLSLFLGKSLKITLLSGKKYARTEDWIVSLLNVCKIK